MSTVVSKKGRFGLLTILGTIIAILGVLSPIIWDRYKATTNLELQYLSSATIVEDSPSLSKLQILYDGKSIKAISNMTFSLVNVGRKPIKKADIVSPPTLTFPEGVNLLDFQIDQLFPSNIKIDHALNKSNRTIALDFPLLNPEDSVQFSILLEGSIPTFQADARILNLKKLIVVDRTDELRKTSGSVPWTVYPVGFFALLFAMMAVGLFYESKKERKERKKYILEKNPLPRLKTKNDYLEFIDTIFHYTTDKKRAPIVNMVNKATQDQLSENAKDSIDAAIIDLVKKDDGNLVGPIFCLALFAIGLWYVLSKVL